MTSRTPQQPGATEARRAAGEHPEGDPRPGASPPPGRRVVLEPTPPGLWSILLGTSLAALGPLFGFLIGSAIGRAEEDAAFSPIALWLFIGIVVGAAGVVLAGWGGVRLWRYFHRRDTAAEEAGVPPGQPAG